MKNFAASQGSSLQELLPVITTPVQTKPDPLIVRGELERVLSSDYFQTSKRCVAFLRYAVEQILSGHQELKERSIGIEVFDRRPTYDTNLDPVVRMTAGEVRKRLALYYQGAAEDPELRIELPVGSYVPRFYSHPLNHLQPHLAGELTLSAVPEVSDPASDTTIERFHQAARSRRSLKQAGLVFILRFSVPGLPSGQLYTAAYSHSVGRSISSGSHC
jgi:hypothetical protein